MITLGEDFALLCIDSIDDETQKKKILYELKSDGKEIIEITESQMHRFAGNMIQLKSTIGDRLIVMSKAAYESLTGEQIQSLEKHGKIIYSDLEMIEACGGGSARCMIAEVFLPDS